MVLVWAYLILDCKMVIYNIFLSDKIYSTYSSLFCFAETNINDSPAKHIDEIVDDWKDIDKKHNMAWLYVTMWVRYKTELINASNVLEVLPIIVEIEKERFSRKREKEMILL